MSARGGGFGAGQVIADRFVLRAELGVGGMGAVWRATQLNLDRDVALKLLLPSELNRPRARARFEREARVASQLKHRHAVQIYDYGRDLDQLWISMELLEGVTLRSMVDRDLAVLPLERVTSILGQVADAVAAAHAIGLVHRDLKPENVFLEATRAVVVDFGLAFIRDRPSSGRVTREGITTGTPDYISPEQAAGLDVGPAADVYSLGALLYEMLTGRPPFDGDPVRVITQQLFATPTPVREVRPELGIPAWISELCMSMIAKSAASRPSMREVCSALLGFDPANEPEERGRGRVYLEGRAARMISTLPRVHIRTLGELYASPGEAEPVTLAVVGALTGDLAIGLGVNGLLAYIVSDTQPIEGADVIFAPGIESTEVVDLMQYDLPIVSDLDLGDLARMTRLLRAGVSEVVNRPVRTDELAAKVWRALRKRRRGTEPR